MDHKDHFSIVPYSFHNPFHDSLRDVTRWFPFKNQRLRIDQAWKNDGKGGTSLGFGASVYDAAILLSLYLDDHSTLVKNKRVLELGCGPGLVGICAASLDAKMTVITDGDSSSIALTNHNISLNKEHLSEDRCIAVEYLWGGDTTGPVSDHGPYDLILGADIVACPYVDAFDGLLNTLNWLILDNSIGLIAYKRRQGSEMLFFKRLQRNFDVEIIPRHEIHQDFKDTEIDLIKIRRRSDKINFSSFVC